MRERLNVYNMHLVQLNQPLRKYKQVKIDRIIAENDKEKNLKSEANVPCQKANIWDLKLDFVYDLFE